MLRLNTHDRGRCASYEHKAKTAIAPILFMLLSEAQQLGVVHATACCGVINATALPVAKKAKTANAMIFFMVHPSIGGSCTARRHAAAEQSSSRPL